MNYTRIEPQTLKDLIDCFWFVEDADPTPREQKIIPDGYPELIFHRGDPFRILIDQNWQIQERSLVAGQISKHFFLANTGISSVAAVKFKPTALTHLFGLDMSGLTDQVLSVHEVLPGYHEGLRSLVSLEDDDMVIVEKFERYIGRLSNNIKLNFVDEAVKRITSSNGLTTVQELCEHVKTSERQLERGFRKFIGISPKRYARIIRFNYIFGQVKAGNDWMTIVESAGFYDQPHFIRDFREFSGEDPSAYAFKEKNLANFFANRGEI